MAPSAAGAACIGPIVSVTVATPDVDASERAYVKGLGYRVHDRSTVSRELARTWQRPATAGARCVTLHPAAADDFSFRFVESRSAAGYRAFTRYGWNAAELIVEDVDALAVELEDGPFEVLGPPQDLAFTDAIRAMQVRGPAGELLYLTEFKRELDSLPAPAARCKVDRAFIVIVAGPSLEGLLDFYTTRFGVPTPQRMESRVKGMSEALGLSPEHRYQIAALPLAGRCYIEADQMPRQVADAKDTSTELPPGIAMVGFRSEATGCVAGPASELIELVRD